MRASFGTTLVKMSPEEWQAVIDTNLTGVFHMTKACLDHCGMAGVINLASIAAVVGFFGQSIMPPPRRGRPHQGAQRGIGAPQHHRERRLAPGVVLTEMGKSIPESVRAEMVKNIPLGRLREPGDIAHAILASPLSAT